MTFELVELTTVKKFNSLFPHIRVRTSSGTFLARGRDKIIRDIERRIAEFTFIPVGMQLNFYRQHYSLRVKKSPNFNNEAHTCAINLKQLDRK